MSWFTDLAGKAENLLNKIDQNAAVVLKDTGSINEQLTDVIWNRNPSRRQSLTQQDSVLEERNLTSTQAATLSRPLRTGSDVISQPPSPALRSIQSRTDVPPLRKTDEEDLLQFLNGSGSLLPGFEDVRGSPSGASVPSAGSSSPVNMVEFSSHGHSRSHSRNVSQGGFESVTSSRPASVRDEPISERCFKPVQVDEGSDRSCGVGQPSVSDIMAENDLLKKEIRTLNSEISLLLQRTKAAEKEVRVAGQELHSLRERQVNAEELEGQLSAIQSQLKSTKEELEILSSENAKLQGQEERSKSDESSSSIELSSIKEKLHQLQIECDRHAEENKDLTSQLSRLQAAVTEGVAQSERLRHQLAQVKTEAEQYKVRATRVLHDKEQLIATLQAGNNQTASESTSVVDQEIEQMRVELDLLRQETVSQSNLLQAARQDLQQLENQLEENRQRSDEEIERLQRRLQEERARRVTAEEDYRSCSEELRMVQQELTSQRDLLAKCVREKENELSRLRQQSAISDNKAQSSNSSTELEARVRHLATALMQKQGALEALIAERNALRIQLESSEKRKSSHISTATASTVLSLNDSENAVRSRVPTLLSENPTDTGMTRSVKRAYSTLDKLGIRVGVFLRRYPLARIFVILYMVLLHLWVALVLFAYPPDADPSQSKHIPIVVPEEPKEVH